MKTRIANILLSVPQFELSTHIWVVSKKQRKQPVVNKMTNMSTCMLCLLYDGKKVATITMAIKVETTSAPMEKP